MKVTKVTTVTKISQNSIYLGSFLPKCKRKASAKGQSPPRELEVGQIFLFVITIKVTYTESKKSRIRETRNLSTDADSRTDTIFERLRDLP